MYRVVSIVFYVVWSGCEGELVWRNQYCQYCRKYNILNKLHNIMEALVATCAATGETLVKYEARVVCPTQQLHVSACNKIIPTLEMSRCNEETFVLEI